MAHRLEELAATLQQVPVPSHAPDSGSPRIGQNQRAGGAFANSPDVMMDSSPYDSHNFSPHEVGILNNIRSAQDLADFNAFMLSLGKDATANLGFPRQPHRQNSNDHASPYSSGSSMSESQHDMFDPATLASLGLAGMPGLPGHHGGHHAGGSVDFGSIYPNDKIRTASDLGGRPIAALPNSRSTRDRMADGDQGSSVGDRESMRNLASSLAASSSMNEAGSSTAPSGSFDFGQALNALGGGLVGKNNSNFSNFDQLAKPRASAQPAKLDMSDFNKNTYRNVNLLGSSRWSHSRSTTMPSSSSSYRYDNRVKLERMTRSPSPYGMDLDNIKRESSVDELEPDSPPLPRGAFPQASMNPRDVLPALRHTSEKPQDVHLTGLRNLGLGDASWLSSSPASTTRCTSPESEYTGGDHHIVGRQRLPSLARLLDGPERKRSYDETLVFDVGRLGLEAMSRRGSVVGPLLPPVRNAAKATRHALAVRDLMVLVNDAWRRRDLMGINKYEDEDEDEDDLRTPIAPSRMVQDDQDEEEDVKPVIRW